MANNGRDAGKERFWRAVFGRQAQSGLAVAEFCRREGLSQPSFYAWRRTIAARGGRGEKPTASRSRAVGFVPVRLSHPAPRSAAAATSLSEAPSITIELSGGLVLRLPEAISPQRLAALVRALEARGLESGALTVEAVR
jgi:hypothetical protein